MGTAYMALERLQSKGTKCISGVSLAAVHPADLIDCRKYHWKDSCTRIRSPLVSFPVCKRSLFKSLHRSTSPLYEIRISRRHVTCVAGIGGPRHFCRCECPSFLQLQHCVHISPKARWQAPSLCLLACVASSRK